MNVYLDIDGVLRGVASPVGDVAEFLKYVLDNFSDSTYWLTTHCRQGYNHCREALLNSELPTDLVERAIILVNTTDFEVLKTDGIDFAKPFIWFDDNLFQSEQKVLEEHGCLSSHFLMDPRDPEMAKKALDLLKILKEKNEY